MLTGGAGNQTKTLKIISNGPGKKTGRELGQINKCYIWTHQGTKTGSKMA